MSNYKIKEILGSKMCLIPSDIGLSKQLVEHGIREEASVNFMKEILKPDWIVIDIGANLGYYALLEAKLCKQVYAIEPIKESVLALRESIKLNRYKNIKVDRLAIGNKNGEFEINLSERSNWATMVDRDKTSKNYQEKFNSFKKGKEIIKTMTLNKFVRKQKIKEINLIRMDVEGFEIEILEDINKTITLMPKGSFLSVEFHPVIFDNREMLINTFEKIIVYYGFEIEKITWHKEEFDLSNTEFRNWLLKKNACPQVFFKRRVCG